MADRLYRLTWSQTEWRSAIVEAESLVEAVHIVATGGCFDSTFVAAEGCDIEGVEYLGTE